MAQKMAKANQSVEKALQLVEVLAQAREPMRLQDVAEAAGLPPSTALRMLHTLILCGYANQDPMTLRYGLTLKFAYIGSLISARLDVRNLAHPLLLELSARCRRELLPGSGREPAGGVCGCGGWAGRHAADHAAHRQAGPSVLHRRGQDLFAQRRTGRGGGIHPVPRAAPADRPHHHQQGRAVPGVG